MEKRQTTKTLWNKIRVFKTYLQMEKKVILVCCITYLVIILVIGHIFNTKSLNEYGQLINGSVNKQLETENLYWKN